MTFDEAEAKAKSLIESGEEDTDSFELLLSKFMEEDTELEAVYVNMDAECEQIMRLYETGLLQPSDL